MSKRHYHLAGVGGVGMSALAQALVAAGNEVTGSDRFLDQGRPMEIFTQLRAAGVGLVPQDGKALRPDTTALVLSTAIEQDNVEIAAARRLEIPLVHRAQMLARLAQGKRCIAIAGTSGKTTVTGMLGWIFECLGRDPTVVNGGAVVNWADGTRVGNVRAGRSGWWIVEADESDRSLLNFKPEWAIINNISKDHFEVEEVTALFRQFATQTKRGVVCGAGVPALLKGAGENGLPTLCEVQITPVRDGVGYRFALGGVDFQVPLAGEHNAWNAAVAAQLCAWMGEDLEKVRQALLSFRGIQRRLETAGAARGITIMDDYAHNPAKITAAWRAVRPFSRRIFGVWRPHGFGPLASMFNELAEAFKALCGPEDRVCLLPVFYVGGTAGGAIQSEALVERLRQMGVQAEWVADYTALSARLLPLLKEGDTVLCMGARDPGLPLFARQLASQIS